mmetsp:Transcript_11235/g.18354  ORF Transcript_11235/g.18354 Transcript_11235/m.18354 type:complete len:92 (-) Transcript_11235:624-899(-)
MEVGCEPVKPPFIQVFERYISVTFKKNSVKWKNSCTLKMTYDRLGLIMSRLYVDVEPRYSAGDQSQFEVSSYHMFRPISNQIPPLPEKLWA